MPFTRARIIQFLSVLIVQALVVLVLEFFTPWIAVGSLVTALAVVVLYAITQSLFWYLFVRFLSWLPPISYPLLTFLLSGLEILIIASFLPGVTINGLGAALGIALVLTIVNALLGALLAVDDDAAFDRNVTQQLVKRRGNPTKTDVPGFLYLEIDGLPEKLLQRALAQGYMPTLKRWLDSGTHKIVGWETDFTAQTGAMQAGILLGSNDNMPAYRWWDRATGKIILSGNPRDALAIETRLTNGAGLLNEGGASRVNMFSGDATENLFTISTLLKRGHGVAPDFYLFLLSPFLVARLFARFWIEVIKEWWQAGIQRSMHQRGMPEAKHIVSSRNRAYAFLRAFMCPILQDLSTYTVIIDVMRGVPAIYALYAGYDDISHYAGMETREAFEMLRETDHYFARIERALQYAPRPYHLLVLSDHGQTTGATFKTAHGVTLEELVKALVHGEGAVFAELDTNEAWDNLNAVLSESIHADTRTANMLKTALAGKTDAGTVNVGPQRDARERAELEAQMRQAELIVLGSGSAGLIYFRQAAQRMNYQEIQARYPELVFGLASHPGIGFVVVHSSENGAMAIGKQGIHFLDTGEVKGVDPLGLYGPNARLHLQRASSFQDCPDIFVNTAYDPQADESCGFENQVSHHGGLGGMQSHPFLMYPTVLPYDGKPIVWATGVYNVLRGWRDLVQKGAAD